VLAVTVGERTPELMGGIGHLNRSAPRVVRAAIWEMALLMSLGRPALSGRRAVRPQPAQRPHLTEPSDRKPVGGFWHPVTGGSPERSSGGLGVTSGPRAPPR
jgi:hypothetical protein